MLAQSASRRWPCRPALARQALLISKIEFEFELDFLTLKAPFAQGLRLNSKANSLAARAPIPRDARDRPLPPRGRSLESVGAKFCAKFTSTVRKSSSNSNSLFRESAPPRPMGA